eukprot:4644865-Pleurochrysis_carterae.AAC.1
MNEEEPVSPKCLVHDEDGALRGKNTGVSSAMLLHWLRESKGIVAQAVRVDLEKAHNLRCLIQRLTLRRC